MMSGPLVNLAAQERLRRSFAAWGLAIFGSLSSSGSVMLDHTGVWAADDAPNGSAASESLTERSNPEKACSEDARHEDPSEARLSRLQLVRLLQAKKIREAAQRVDAALEADPSAANYVLSYMLASHLSRQEPLAAQERLQSIIAGLGDQLGDSASSQAVSCYTMSAQLLAQLIDAQGESSRALSVLEQATEKVSAMPAPMTFGLLVERCRILIRIDRAEEAKTMMDKRVEDAFARAVQLPSLGHRMAVPAAISAYSRLFREQYPEPLNTYRQRARDLLLPDLEKEDAGPEAYQVYQALQISTAMELSESDPQAAKALLYELQERAARMKERLADDERKRLLSLEHTLQATLARVEAQLLQRALIGQPAPELEIASVVNMQPVQWADLKGKVVLLDFWAVWCGPCVHTFPHLRKLDQEFAPRGLVIIGVTRPYGYSWDAETKRAVPNEDATMEEELAMLEEFRKEHELEYGFIVTPRQSETSKKFGVTGIPQAVVVDQNGVIQMIRVGGNDQNGSDIEAKIEELLAEPPENAQDAS